MLDQAIATLGFVQADPIRAPARAQDLTLRHRVSRYTAGDLERRYAELDVEEDFFVNHGFLPRSTQALMHPRGNVGPALASPRRKRVQQVLAFVAERGVVHPRDVDGHFSHGTVTNYWGGTSNATTHLLGGLHYQGLLRVAGRERGIRLYSPRPQTDPPADTAERHRRIDRLIDVAVRLYAPLPVGSLATLVGRLRYGVPQWRTQLKAAFVRARSRLARARVDGVDWYWPADEVLEPHDLRDDVRLLAPFDPIVWDRRRFERLWNWEYRFEAYTPAAKRLRGYYALPLLWRDAVVGWANVSVTGGVLTADIGYVKGRRPRDAGFKAALDDELSRLGVFLELSR